MSGACWLIIFCLPFYPCDNCMEMWVWRVGGACLHPHPSATLGVFQVNGRGQPTIWRGVRTAMTVAKIGGPYEETQLWTTFQSISSDSKAIRVPASITVTYLTGV